MLGWCGRQASARRPNGIGGLQASEDEHFPLLDLVRCPFFGRLLLLHLAQLLPEPRFLLQGVDRQEEGQRPGYALREEGGQGYS